ncbi:MAG: hypothetical protein AB9846_00770 [Tenuifilaceae bacterium]
MIYLVGIDDTDNLESRGTGFIGRTMGEVISASGLGICGGVSRHQLLFDPRVPYTSHNSSLCLELESNQPDKMWDLMIDYLLKSCAPGSDCGLCMVESDKVPASIIEWGKTAKRVLVTQVNAVKLAEKEGVRLVGLTGNHDGIIGAMAAVGLRASGNDGRFVGLKGTDVRLINGIKTPFEIKKLVHLHQIVSSEGEIIEDHSLISLDGWLRPVHHEGLITLIVNKIYDNEEYSYQLATKEYIKSISD